MVGQSKDLDNGKKIAKKKWNFEAFLGVKRVNLNL